MALFRRRPFDTRTRDDLDGIWFNQRLDVGEFNHGNIKTCLIAAAFPTSPMFGHYARLTPLTDPARTKALLRDAVDGRITRDELVAAVFASVSFVDYVEQVDEIEQTTRGAVPDWMLDQLATTKATKGWTSAIQHGTPHPGITAVLESIGAGNAGESHVVVHAPSGRHTGSLWYDAARAGFCAAIHPFEPVDTDFGWSRTEFDNRPMIWAVRFRQANRPHPLDVVPTEIAATVEATLDELAHGAERRHGPQTLSDCRPHTFDGPTPYPVTLRQAAVAGAMLAVTGIDSSACRLYGGSPKRLLDPAEHPWPSRANR